MVVDGGGEHGRDDGQVAGFAGKVGREPEVRLADVRGLVVEGIVEVDAVVVHHQVDMVVAQLDPAQVDGRAGHVGAERVVPVVEDQPEILQVPGAEGEAAGGDVAVHAAVLVNLEPQGGVLLDIQAREDESQQLAGIVELEVHLVRRSAPGLSDLFQQGRKLLPDHQVLEVRDHGHERTVPDEGALGEAGFEQHPVDVVIRVRAGPDVADVVPAARILQLDVPEVDLAQEVPVPRADEVRIGLERDLGGPPLVDVQGVEVRIADIREELVGGVPGAGGQVELALDEGVQVRVVAHDAAVEGLVRVGAHGRDAGIVIAQGAQPPDVQGVDPDLQVAGGEGDIDPGGQGDGTQFLDAGDPPGVQVLRAEDAVQGDVPLAVQDVPEGEVHVGRTRVGREVALHREAVQRALRRGVQAEVRAPAHLSEVQLRVGGPFLDEGAEPAQPEAEVLDTEVQQRGLDVGKPLHRPVDAARDPAAVFPDAESLDGEVAHSAFHLAGEVRPEGETLQVRGEMADGLHREDGRVHEFALEADPVHEVVIVVQRAQEAEIAEMQVGLSVVDVEVVQQDLPVPDLHFAG